MKKLNYGIDAPIVIRNLLLIGFVLLLCSLFLPTDLFPPISILVKNISLFPAISLILAGVLMLAYAKFGKFKHRDRMLNLYEWKGNENVLDVGTGLGLLMIGAAKKLTTGKSIGIDIWNVEDLSNNTLHQTKQNVIVENVIDRTEILSQNILQTSFKDSSFDVVMSNLCLHNIYDKTQRETACKEISRILKDNGVVIISDFKHTKEYQKVFKKVGMIVEKIGTYYLDTFPPLTIIRARKTTMLS